MLISCSLTIVMFPHTGWAELAKMMSTAEILNHTLVETGQPFYSVFEVCGNISNIGSRLWEYINIESIHQFHLHF